ncbi:MAG: hypothetical protein WD361_02350 [Gracilimonas sp.]
MITLKNVFFVLLFTIISFPSFAQIFVNEIVASNGQGLQDDDGDYPDWIELYNTTSFAINISGWIVKYDEDSWDSNADGTGSSLELLNPTSDNYLPECWMASTQNGGAVMIPLNLSSAIATP